RLTLQDCCWIKANLRGISTDAPQKSRDEAAEQSRRIGPHPNDARIVEARRPDHAEHADDPVFGILEGRDDERRAREREQLVLGADEDTHAFGAFGEAKQLDQILLRVEILEEKAHALEVFHRPHIFDATRAAADAQDTLSTR